MQRRRSWCVSTDKEFAVKAADVVALYLNPPLNALVLSVDEKPSIQAIERAVGYVETDSGKVVRAMKSTYKRHGTLNLFAALEVGTGQVHTKFTESKKREDFRSFLDDVLADQPKDKEIHVILDNYSPHKRNDDWLAKYVHAAGLAKFPRPRRLPRPAVPAKHLADYFRDGSIFCRFLFFPIHFQDG